MKYIIYKYNYDIGDPIYIKSGIHNHTEHAKVPLELLGASF
jgi:hypothetical protein